jgi:predicted Zn-dependent protease
LIEPFASQNPRDQVLQVAYAIILAHVGRHADAAEVAARVRESVPRNAFTLYNAACAYSVAAELGGKPDADRTEEERKLAAGYAESALECLRAAVAAGFADQTQIRIDTDLAAVRKHSGFADILKKLNATAVP